MLTRKTKDDNFRALLEHSSGAHFQSLNLIGEMVPNRNLATLPYEIELTKPVAFVTLTPGCERGAVLGKTDLLASLMDLVDNFLEQSSKCRLLLLDILANYFKNSEPTVSFEPRLALSFSLDQKRIQIGKTFWAIFIVSCPPPPISL